MLRVRAFWRDGERGKFGRKDRMPPVSVIHTSPGTVRRIERVPSCWTRLTSW